MCSSLVRLDNLEQVIRRDQQGETGSGRELESQKYLGI
jgi:hypothetical protein